MKKTERIRFIGGRHVINSDRIQILILSKQKEHCYLHLNYAWPTIPSFAVPDRKI